MNTDHTRIYSTFTIDLPQLSDEANDVEASSSAKINIINQLKERFFTPLSHFFQKNVFNVFVIESIFTTKGEISPLVLREEISFSDEQFKKFSFIYSKDQTNQFNADNRDQVVSQEILHGSILSEMSSPYHFLQHLGLFPTKQTIYQGLGWYRRENIDLKAFILTEYRQRFIETTEPDNENDLKFYKELLDQSGQLLNIDALKDDNDVGLFFESKEFLVRQDQLSIQIMSFQKDKSDVQQLVYALDLSDIRKIK